MIRSADVDRSSHFPEDSSKRQLRVDWCSFHLKSIVSSAGIKPAVWVSQSSNDSGSDSFPTNSPCLSVKSTPDLNQGKADDYRHALAFEIERIEITRSHLRFVSTQLRVWPQPNSCLIITDSTSIRVTGHVSVTDRLAFWGGEWGWPNEWLDRNL